MMQWGAICKFCIAVECNDCNRQSGYDPTKFVPKDHIKERPPDDVRSTDNYYEREKERHVQYRQTLEQSAL